MFEHVMVRVYALPAKLTDGYCFGSGVPITFQNVDWFEAPLAGTRDELISFIKGKRYYIEHRAYLVLGDHPDFTFQIPAGVRP